MAQPSRSNITPFPSARPSAVEGASRVVQGESETSDIVSASAFTDKGHQLPFTIDEPDPLLISETMSSEFIAEPRQGQAELKLVSGEERRKTHYLRIKDLHPIDLMIAAGLIAIGLFW